MICLFMFFSSVEGLSLTFTFKMAIYTIYESLTKYMFTINILQLLYRYSNRF